MLYISMEYFSHLESIFCVLGKGKERGEGGGGVVGIWSIIHMNSHCNFEQTGAGSCSDEHSDSVVYSGDR